MVNRITMPSYYDRSRMNLTKQSSAIDCEDASAPSRQMSRSTDSAYGESIYSSPQAHNVDSAKEPSFPLVCSRPDSSAATEETLCEEDVRRYMFVCHRKCDPVAVVSFVISLPVLSFGRLQYSAAGVMVVIGFLMFLIVHQLDLIRDHR